MKKLAIASIAAIFATLLSIQSAQAGQLSSNDASISWDESNFYYPSGCSSFTFNYNLANSVLFASIKVTNKFGDNAGSTSLSGTGTSGAKSLQICSTYAKPEFAPFLLSFEVQQSFSTGSGKADIVTAPLNFISRSATPTKSQTPAASQSPDLSQGLKVCVDKKTYSLIRANSAGKCSAGQLLRILK
jgi:hypothetical protein